MTLKRLGTLILSKRFDSFLLGLAIVLGLLAFVLSAWGATPLAAAQVLVCPGALFPARCAAPVYAPLTSPLTAASVSKSTPVWGHTFGGYAQAVLVVVCPVGAILSADNSTCTNAAGGDGSVLLAKSAVTTVPPPIPPGPANQQVVITSTDLPAMSVTVSGVPVPGCFTVASVPVAPGQTLNPKRVCVP